ncbi:MAG: NPCBM/NEW2 domain-containing protein [Clostridia bacterium]|nr:NPCBM/NEW2 domain-containing protein [Clostridia bacterium]
MNNDEKKEINWEKWGVIIAIVFGLLGLFGITLKFGPIKLTSPLDTSSNVTSIESSLYESQPTEEEINEQIQKKTGKVWIEDMRVLQHQTDDDSMKYDNPSIATDVTGTSYSHNLLLVKDYVGWGWINDGDKQTVSYYVNNKYSSFTATVALDENTRDPEESVQLIIYSDGNVAYKKKISGGFVPEEINIDLEGVIKLEIQMVIKCAYYSCNVIIGDAYFTPAE